MELFKLFGTIAITNADANDAIDDTTDRAEQSEGRISSAFKKIGTAVATYFAVDKIKDFGMNCINAAADAEAASSQFTQVFGDMESQASKSLKGIADDTGIQTNRMKGSYTKIAAFAKTTGMDTESALGLADRAMIAVADSAAFYDRSLEETTESLQSFLKGNYENDSALGLSCTETTRNAAANALYGKSFKDLSEAQKQLTLLQMVEDANKASGALGQAARESDTWTNQTGNLKQAWTDFQAALGTNVLPLVVDAVKGTADAVQGLTDKMPIIIEHVKGFFDKCVELSPVILGVATAIGVFTVAMNFSTILQTAVGALKGLKTAVLGVNAALNANPIALIVSLIAGLVAAIIALWNTNEDFRNAVIKVWNAIKTGISTALNTIKTVITTVWNGIKTTVSTVVNGIKTTVTNVWNTIKSTIQTVMNAVKTTISTIWNGIKTTVSSVINSIKTVISSVFNTIKTTISNILNGIKTKFSTIWNGIKTTVSNVITGVKTAISGGLNIAKTTVSNVLNSIKTKFSTIFESAKNIVKNAIEKIKGFFNFSWGLPKIKMPHFTITGKFSINPPSIPHFGVEWYKKAMDEPYMFTKPTIFDVNPTTGKARGAGEAGDEMMIGKDTLLNMIREAVAMENAALLEKLDEIAALLLKYFPLFAGMQIVLDDGTLVGRLSPGISRYVKQDISREMKNNKAGRGEKA